MIVGNGEITLPVYVCELTLATLVSDIARADILNVFDVVPLKLPLPVIVTVPVPTLTLLEYVSV